MRIQMNEGHLRPSVTNSLFAEPCLEGIQGEREPLGSLPLPVIGCPLFKQQSLLGVCRQAGHAERERPEPDAPPHRFLKERHDDRREITLPTRLRLNPLML